MTLGMHIMNRSESVAEVVSVVLVEDDQFLRDSLTEYLELKGLRVKAVGTASDFYALLEQHRFHVAVIDLGLPDVSGEALVDFARQNSEMSLIVITANDGLNSRVNCYRSGADLFMGKPIEGQELAAAIMSLAERHQSRLQPDNMKQRTPDGWLLNSKNWTLTLPCGEEIVCTVKEYRLLALLAETPSEPVRRSRLLIALYGRDDGSAQRALDTLVRRLRQKINPYCAEEALPIRTVYSVGYMFVDQIT